MIRENQLLLKTLVSISPSSLSYPACACLPQADLFVDRQGSQARIALVCGPYSNFFGMDFCVVRTLFSASDINFSA